MAVSNTGSSSTGSSSIWMRLVRIAVGVMFLFFAQYKLMHTAFAHGGYEGWVKPWADQTSLYFYRPFLIFTLRHQVIFAYATGVVELLIGLSMVLGWWVRTFSLIGILFMLNLTFATWYSPPPGSAYWKYLGSELDHIPLLLLFILFIAHNAGQSLGLDAWVSWPRRKARPAMPDRLSLQVPSEADKSRPSVP